MSNPGQHTPSGELAAGLSFGGMAAYDKSGLVGDYAEHYHCRTVIETGLFQGAGSGMKLADRFEYVAFDYQPANIEAAQAKGFRAVLGDTAVMLHRWLETDLEVYDGTYCFWLDAHAVYEWEDAPTRCPVLYELAAIIAADCFDSVVLIDDLWGMGTVSGWPTLDELLDLAAGAWDVSTEGGILRLTPKGWPAWSPPAPTGHNPYP